MDELDAMNMFIVLFKKQCFACNLCRIKKGLKYCNKYKKNLNKIKGKKIMRCNKKLKKEHHE